MSNTTIKDELSAKITQSSVPVWVVDGVECRDFPTAVKQLLVRVIAVGAADDAQHMIADRILSTGSRGKIRALLDMLDEYEVMEKLKPSESGDRTQIR